MIKSLELENFRCYKSESLKNLRRMNVLVGENGSGKTALLEAIFLACGSGPEVGLRLRAWRGLGDEITISTTIDDVWLDLFYEFNKELGISIRIVDSSGVPRSLRVYYGAPEAMVLALGKSLSEQKRPAPISFAFKVGTGEPEVASVELTDRGIKLASTSKAYPGSFLTPASGRSAGEHASRFSELSKRNEEEEIIAALREQFPQIESLSVELYAGTPMIWVKLRALKHKMPIALLSSGISNYLGILLAIAASRRGFVLIDEIDNGMHYSILPMMWKQIHGFAVKFEVQIFASTHSRECLQAALPTIEGCEGEFCLIRTSKANGASRIEQISGKQFEAAVNQDVEIR